MKFDEYILYARLFPAILTSIPFVLFNHFYINSELSGFLHVIWALKWIEAISMPIVFILAFSFINRTISKMFIEYRRYDSERKMPTTNILLFDSNLYTTEYKNKIHAKILREFGIRLLSLTQERAQKETARKKIVEAVSCISEKMKNGRLILQHNMEYGFFRNLIGGSVIAFIFCLFCSYFFHFSYLSSLAFRLSILGTIIYGSIFIFHGRILDWHGYLYAKRLMQEFMLT